MATGDMVGEATPPEKPTHTEWFEVVTGSQLFQGDIIGQLPFFTRLHISETDPAEGGGDLEEVDAIVLTQTCDLVEQGDKSPRAHHVLLAPVRTRDALAEDPVWRKHSNWSEAAKGRLTGSHILNRCELAGHRRDYSHIELLTAFSLPLSLVSERATEMGERLRLKAPYREALSQAFAHCYMRVALPDDPPFAVLPEA